MTNMHPSDVPLYLWVILAAILFAQSTILFINARRHGHNYWLWGIIGLLNFPTATLLYLIFAKRMPSKLWKRQ